MNSVLNKSLSILRTIERFLVVSINLLMVFLYTFNVLVRLIAPEVSSSFAWIDEATRILMVWSIFLALGLALERGRQVAVTTIFEKLPNYPQKIVNFFINLTGFVFSCYLVHLSYILVQFVMRTGQTSPTLGISMYWLYIAPSIGFVLLALRYGLELVGINDRHNRPIILEIKN